MRTLLGCILGASLMGACRSGDELDVSPLLDDTPLELRVDTPTYGGFAGNGELLVEGSVTDPRARVTVEEFDATVRADGRFSVSLPPLGAEIQVIDVRADRSDDDEAELWERIPVFAGRDPAQTWPGALAGRLTERGLDSLEGTLELLIADLLDLEGLLSNVGSFALDGFSITVLEPQIAPLEVELKPGPNGLLAAVGVPEVVVGVEIEVDALFGLTIPASLTITNAGAGFIVDPTVDDQANVGLTLVRGDVLIGDISLDVDLLGLGLLDGLLDQVVNLEDLLLGAVDGILPRNLELPLGIPLAFELDLLGNPLYLGVGDLGTDEFGVAARIDVSFGEALPAADGRLAIPGSREGVASDLALTVHDALLQPLLENDLLDVLDQDLDLGGLAATFLRIEDLPGGGQAPDYDSVCVGLDLGEARLGRFGDAPERLVHLLLADARVEIGLDPVDGAGCEPWLEVAYAWDLQVGLDGTVLSIDLETVEGDVLYYGASSANEELLVRDLGERLEGVIGLVGGFADLDLGDLLGGGLGEGLGLPGIGDLSLSVVDVLAFEDPTLEGQVEVGLQLFDAPTP